MELKKKKSAFLGLICCKMTRRNSNLLLASAAMSSWKHYSSVTDVDSPNWSELAVIFIESSKISSNRSHFCVLALQSIYCMYLSITKNSYKSIQIPAICLWTNEISELVIVITAFVKLMTNFYYLPLLV